MIHPGAPLACPLCALSLNDGGKFWHCSSNHHFDLARQGYLNLLPASQKTSRDPGDSKSMFDARRSVFASGLYKRFADALSQQVYLRVSAFGSRSTVVLDAACGEGYFTNHICAAINGVDDEPQAVVMGVDISKWGVIAAARAYPEVTWLVGNNKHLPVLQGSVDIITSVFGFETWKPWAALQTPGQWVLVAHAGPRHLIELRELIYDKVTIHGEADDTEATEAGYELIERATLSYVISVESVDVAEKVLAMTPHGYRISADKHEDLKAELGRLIDKPLTIDILFRWYQR